MSLTTLERAILAEAKTLFNNSKLRPKDIVGWSSGEIKDHSGEINVLLPELGVWVAVKNEFDKRVKK